MLSSRQSTSNRSPTPPVPGLREPADIPTPGRRGAAYPDAQSQRPARTNSSPGVVRSLVVIATPDGPAPGHPTPHEAVSVAMTSLLWDQHICLPLQTDTDVDPLTRYQRPGGAFVSVNAGYSPHSFNDTLALLRHYRAAVEAHPGLEVAASIGRWGSCWLTPVLRDRPRSRDGRVSRAAARLGAGGHVAPPRWGSTSRICLFWRLGCGQARLRVHRRHQLPAWTWPSEFRHPR